MALFDWTKEEKWRHIKHFMDTHNYSESNLQYLKSWVTFITAPSYEEVFGETKNEINQKTKSVTTKSECCEEGSHI